MAFWSLPKQALSKHNSRVTLSVVLITFNEEANLRQTLESVRAIADEIIVVDSGSHDRTVDVARELGAKVFAEEWKGFAAQKNSALEKATGDWILSLDADEELDLTLQMQLKFLLGKATETDLALGAPPFDQVMADWAKTADSFDGFYLRRKNLFLGRWIRHGGYWPDPKLRLFRRGSARFEERLVHEDARGPKRTDTLRGALVHHSYPTLAAYIEHMDRYSTLGAEMAVARGKRGFSFINIVVRPILTFKYNYFLRLGFLDGREGLLLHLYHAAYISWKYAKVWERTRRPHPVT